MKRAWIRSTLFNILFMAMTLACCIVFLPTLLLPRKSYLVANTLWHKMIVALEYGVMGLTYEVRGAEHLPKAGSFLVAAKHMSPYETFKLRLLLDDPAIILKQELLRIPLWGAYLRKSDVIAIDRSTPERALKSIEDGALRMKAQGRPIVIFPQGTRVRADETPEQKKYKAGIARVQEATGLPIVPMATNSGLFWPRSGWLKSPGKVVFEFLPPIAPGQDRKAMMHELEQKLESQSNALMNEARATALQDGGFSWMGFLKGLVFAALAFAVYSWLWHVSARAALDGYNNFMSDLSEPGTEPVTPRLSGYPGRITLSVDEDTIRLPDGTIRFENLRIRGWPLPLLPLSIKTGALTLDSFKWKEPLNLDSIRGHARMLGHVLTVTDSEVRKESFLIELTGTLNLAQEPVPEMDMVLAMQNHAPFLAYLAQRKIIKERMALFMSAAFSALADEDGVVRVPVTQQGKKIYAGPIPVASLPALHRPGPGSRPVPAQ
jgi:1-acyl-sn-glycerol-3-phosphate acyltransferase